MGSKLQGTDGRAGGCDFAERRFRAHVAATNWHSSRALGLYALALSRGGERKSPTCLWGAGDGV